MQEVTSITTAFQGRCIISVHVSRGKTFHYSRCVHSDTQQHALSDVAVMHATSSLLRQTAGTEAARKPSPGVLSIHAPASSGGSVIHCYSSICA
jgi:hypothetical protein